MRATLPIYVGISHHVWNCSQVGALLASILEGNLLGLEKTLLVDKIIEPKRAPLIPRIEAVKQAAMKVGTFRCTIREVRPMAMDVIDNGERGKDVGGRMVEALWQEGNLKVVAMVKRLDRVGARLLDSVSLR